MRQVAAVAGRRGPPNGFSITVKIRVRYFQFIAIWGAVLAAIATLAGCRQSQVPLYEFEPVPHPVMGSAVFDFSRNARIGSDWISSPNLYLLAVLGNKDTPSLALLNSEDGGDSFGPPEWVEGNATPVSSVGENSPAFVSTPDWLYAAWNEGRDLRFARSRWGAPFQKPLKVTDKTTDTFSGYPSIGVAPNGDVYIVWIDTRPQPESPDRQNYSLYMARSTDQGVTFGGNIRVATDICPCCRPTVTFGPKGEVLVIWRHIYPGPIHDMTVATTTDGGKTFSQPERVAVDNWKIDGCPDSGPTAVRSGNRVYVAWLTEASPEISGVRLAWSDDAGRTWAPAVKGSQAILDANYPAMSVDDAGHVVLVFQGRDPKQQAGWAGTGIFAVSITPDGKLSAPVPVPGIPSSAHRPAVAAGTGGRIYVVWTGVIRQKETVYLSRARLQFKK